MTPPDKKPQCFVTTYVASQEKERFIEVASTLDIPHSRIMRQLVRYILQGRIGWLNLFAQTNDFLASEKAAKVSMRTKLSPELYTPFVQLAESNGSTTSIVMRRLILLYITGKIEWKSIWLTPGGAVKS